MALDTEAVVSLVMKTKLLVLVLGSAGEMDFWVFEFPTKTDFVCLVVVVIGRVSVVVVVLSVFVALIIVRVSVEFSVYPEFTTDVVVSLLTLVVVAVFLCPDVADVVAFCRYLV